MCLYGADVWYCSARLETVVSAGRLIAGPAVRPAPGLLSKRGFLDAVEGEGDLTRVADGMMFWSKCGLLLSKFASSR